MEENPLVSCITPTFNRSKLVREAIESNIAQTYHNWEMLVIDDQSTDDTWEVIKHYEKLDARIRGFKNPEKGANNARNLGIAKARGNFVAFLDDDDVNLPHRYESQIRAMRKSGSRFILSWFEIRDRSKKHYWKTNRTVLDGKTANFTVRWMIEKSLLEEVGGFNPKMVSMQEIELSYRIAAKYTFDHHDDIVVTVYNDPSSISKGLRGITGKLMLLEEVGDLIPRDEKAFWLLSVALNYLRMNKLPETLTFFEQAKHIAGYLQSYDNLFKPLAFLSAKTGCGLWVSRFLSRIIKMKKSETVYHRVISNN